MTKVTEKSTKGKKRKTFGGKAVTWGWNLWFLLSPTQVYLWCDSVIIFYVKKDVFTPWSRLALRYKMFPFHVWFDWQSRIYSFMSFASPLFSTLGFFQQYFDRWLITWVKILQAQVRSSLLGYSSAGLTCVVSSNLGLVQSTLNSTRIRWGLCFCRCDVSQSFPTLCWPKHIL